MSELDELKRMPAGWRISRMKHTALWRAGDMLANGPVTSNDVSEMRDHLSRATA